MNINLGDYLAADAIIPDLSAQDYNASFQIIADKIASSCELAASDIAAALSAREGLRSTVLVPGVAIPHARFSTLKRIIIIYARSLDGVDFHSPDNQKVHHIFTILSPENATSEHILVLSKIVNLIRKTSLIKQLSAAEDRSDLCAILQQEELLS